MFNLDWGKRTHKGLRRFILFALKASPKNGAEIMDSIESVSQGWWRPSPGSIYPLLDSMVEEGLVTQQADKRYVLTDKGLDEMQSPWGWFGRPQESPRTVEDVLENLSNYVKYLEDLNSSQKEKVVQNQAAIRKLGDRLVTLGEGRK